MLCAALYTYYNFILYIKTHCQWITVESTVSNQSPKTLRWSVRQTQLLPKDCQNIASFIPSYSDTNIILEYNFLGKKGPYRHLLSSLFIDYFYS